MRNVTAASWNQDFLNDDLRSSGVNYVILKKGSI